MADFPNLRNTHLVAMDTETTGLTFKDRAVGISYATPDGREGYVRWGHKNGQNNCTLEEAKRWMKGELSTPGGTTVVFHNAAYDLRMLAYDGMFVNQRVEDTGFLAALLNEYEEDLTLDGLGERYLGERKESEDLYRWCAEAFGGRAVAHGKTGQAQNIWRAPGGIVEPYAIQDARLTLKLHQHLFPLLAKEDLSRIYETEVALIHPLLKMHLVGVRVDQEYAQNLRRDMTRKRDALAKRWNRETGSTNPRSGPQMAALFDSWGIPYPRTGKLNAKTGQRNPSFKKEFLQGVDHPVIQEVLMSMKVLNHLGDTFIDSYILGNVGEDGLIHGEFHQLRKDFDAEGGGQFGTVSGRFSSGGGLNLQNLPSRDPIWGPAIRGCFVPYTPDHQWVKADYSQIEYRLLAHYGGGQLRDAYLNDPLVDFHQALADLTGVPRKDAKNLNFGIVYGMGPEALAISLGVTLEEAEDIMAQYHERAPEVKMIYNKASNAASNRGYIRTWGGRVCRFQENPLYGKERTSKRGKKYRDRNKFEGGHKSLNRILQGSAADMMKLALPRVADAIDWEEAILHLTVHDELDLSVIPSEKGHRMIAQVKELMEDMKHSGEHPLTVPIIADAEIGPDWGHVEQWENPHAKAA